MSTIEQRAALTTLRELLKPFRLRVTADVEGWPIVMGRHGQLEWHDGATVTIYSRAMRVLTRLLTVPGIRRHQMGDDEFRLLLPVERMHHSGALAGVARLLRLRTRRIQSERQKLALLHGRRLFQARVQEAP